MQQVGTAVSMSFHRYMYNQINWERKMFGLVGPRGVGKTTLFLQYIKEHGNECKMFYVSADNVIFASHSLIDISDQFVRDGQRLFIDDLQKYTNWTSELKQIYDNHSDLIVSFTGASILDIFQGEAYLSCRAPNYRMRGLSYREFLAMFKGVIVPVATLEQALRCVVVLPDVPHLLPWFKEYLLKGYYPFGDDPQFEMISNQIVKNTLDIDIPQYARMSVATSRKLRHLVIILSLCVPFKPKMDNLAAMVGVSCNVLPDYFEYMDKAGMVGQLRDDAGGIRGPEQVDIVILIIQIRHLYWVVHQQMWIIFARRFSTTKSVSPAM